MSCFYFLPAAQHHLVCMPGARCVRSELGQDTMDADCQQLTLDLCSPLRSHCPSVSQCVPVCPTQFQWWWRWREEAAVRAGAVIHQDVGERQRVDCIDSYIISILLNTIQWSTLNAVITAYLVTSTHFQFYICFYLDIALLLPHQDHITPLYKLHCNLLCMDVKL